MTSYTRCKCMFCLGTPSPHGSATMQASVSMILFTLVVTLINMDAVELQDVNMDIKEYCENEYFFKPACEENKVIVIKYARYGRMHEGRCIPGAKDFLGCSMETKDILGGKCSGRRSCEVLISSIPLSNNYPCDETMRGYLEAAFECVDVIYPPRGYCRTGEVTEIKEESGYLSSVVAKETECGTSLSPWWVSVEPGKQLRFSLHAFSDVTNNLEQGVQVYAVLDEESARTSRPLTDNVPELTTVGNRVKVTIMITGVDGQSMDNFLVRFEATGCPDILPPVNGWSRRAGGKVHMGCNSTDSQEMKAEWTFRCVDNNWIGKMQACAAIQHGNPPPNAAAAKDRDEWNLFTESNAMYIAAGLGLAILIGLCLLVLGLVYICRLKRRRRCPPERPINSSSRRPLHDKECPRAREHILSAQEEGEGDYYCPAQRGYHKNWPEESNRRGNYPHQHGPSAADMPLPPPPYTPSRPLSFGPTNRWSCTTGAEHVYERPTFSIPPSDHAAEGDTHSMSTSYNPADQPCPDCDHMNTL